MAEMFVEMTVAEKFRAIAEVVEDQEMAEFLLDRAEKAVRKSTAPRKPKAEVVERKAAMATYVAKADAPITAAVAAEALDMTPGQARAALTALVKDGVVVSAPGERKADPKVYSIA